jgi:hypothetical protein
VIDSVFQRAKMALHLIDLFPSIVRSEMLSDSELLDDLGIKNDVNVSFNHKSATFSRKELFSAIRTVYQGIEDEVSLKDVDGDAWSLYCSAQGQGFSLNKGGEVIYGEDFWPLYADIKKRIEIFEKLAKDRLFSKADLDRWIPVISQEVVDDDQVSGLFNDLKCSPKYVEKLLRSQFREEANDASCLVPDNLLYYERLVGKYCGSESIVDYCNTELSDFFSNRVADEIDQNDLLICMHGEISKVISIGISDNASYQVIAKRAIETCHPILLISCLEIGVVNYSDSSSVIIKDLLECISSNKTQENLALFCCLAMYVDGELARLQIFKGMPPFYRRLASLSQAALIVKICLEEQVVFEGLDSWVQSKGGYYFYCQNFIDLLNEPRWIPNYLVAEQLLNEIYGRVSNVCSSVDKCEVVEFLISEIHSDSRLKLHSFLPGPLEGKSAPANVPNEISNSLNETFKETPSLESYMIFLNSAPFWKIDEELLDRAVLLLENAQHQLASVNDKDSVYQILTGLAQASCMTRSVKLAASVAVLSRLYRDYIDVDSEPENYLAIGVVAGAAFEDKDDWAEYIGQWCTELSYLPMNVEAISRVSVMLEILCILEPYLYHTCSKALDIFSMLKNK